MKKPGVRVIDGKRIDLVELRKRRKLARENAKPVEDTRVSDMWARDDAKQESAALDRSEEKAIRAMKPRIEVGSEQVDNPLYMRDHAGDKTNHRQISVPFNHKESAISALAAKRAIDEAQAAAAVRFRSLWEAVGGAGAKAIDYSKEPVDGGGAVEPISLKQLTAGSELKRASDALKSAHGLYAYRLVGYVAGEGRSIHEMTETRRQRDTMTDNLRTYLDVLAELWGFRTRNSFRSRNGLTRARENDIRG